MSVWSPPVSHWDSCDVHSVGTPKRLREGKGRIAGRLCTVLTMTTVRLTSPNWREWTGGYRGQVCSCGCTDAEINWEGACFVHNTTPISVKIKCPDGIQLFKDKTFVKIKGCFCSDAIQITILVPQITFQWTVTKITILKKIYELKTLFWL